MKSNQKELSELTSKKGYEIYQNLAKDYQDDSADNWNIMVNTLQAAVVYLMANKVKPEKYNFFVEELSIGLKNSVKDLSERIKNKNKPKDEPEYLFSEEFRDLVEKFIDGNVNECLKNPAFFDELLNHAGMSVEEKKSLWVKVGRTDIPGSY